ncbi:hypothetical protein Tco_0039227 [Tanacetum coccineum]
MDISTTPYFQITTHLKAYGASCQKDSQENRSSLQSIVDPLAMCSPNLTCSFISPQLLVLNLLLSLECALLAPLTQIANLLRVTKAVSPTNNQLGLLQHNGTHVRCMMVRLLLNQFREATWEEGHVARPYVDCTRTTWEEGPPAAVAFMAIVIPLVNPQSVNAQEHCRLDTTGKLDLGTTKLDRPSLVIQKDLSGDQAYWLSANEIASQASKSATPATPFVRKSRPPSQVLASLRNVNAVFPQFEAKLSGKPTGRHFSLFEKHPLTRIMESTDQPIELPPSASSSPKILWSQVYWIITLVNRQAVVQFVLWYLDSVLKNIYDRCVSCNVLLNFVEKFIGTVRFGNDEYAAIIGYGDYKLGDTIISRVYYVEGLKHNLFSVGQFCDGGLEVPFRSGIHVTSAKTIGGSIISRFTVQTICTPISLNDMMSASPVPVCLVQRIFNSTVKVDSIPIHLKTENTIPEVLPYIIWTLRPMTKESIRTEHGNELLMDAAPLLCSFLRKAPLCYGHEAVTTAKAYDLQQRKRKIQENVQVAFAELTKDASRSALVDEPEHLVFPLQRQQNTMVPLPQQLSQKALYSYDSLLLSPTYQTLSIFPTLSISMFLPQPIYLRAKVDQAPPLNPSLGLKDRPVSYQESARTRQRLLGVSSAEFLYHVETRTYQARLRALRVD